MINSAKLRILLEIAIVFAVMLGIKDVADRLEVIGAGSIAMWCGIVVATVFLKRRGVGWRNLGLILPRGLREWLVTLGLALLAVVGVILFMALALEPITQYFGWISPPEASDRFAFLLGRPFAFLAYLVVVVWVGAAVGEELLMRGFVLNRLADFFGHGAIGWTLAMVIHAIVFGLLHIYQGVPGMVGTGVVALIFGCVYLLGKRRLMPLIIGHGIINTISLTAYYLSDGKIT